MTVKKFLLTLWNDPNHHVRWTVADTLGTGPRLYRITSQ